MSRTLRRAWSYAMGKGEYQNIFEAIKTDTGKEVEFLRAVKDRSQKKFSGKEEAKDKAKG